MNACQGNFLVIQWLGLSTFITVGPGWSLVRELRSRKQHIVVRKRHVELKWNCTIYWDSSFSNTLSLISWYFNHFCFFFWKEILLYFGCQQRWGRAVVVLSLSCVQLLWPHALWPSSLLCPWNFPGKNTRVSCNFILQGIFPTQASKLHLLHYRQILYHWATREAPFNHFLKVIFNPHAFLPSSGILFPLSA